MVTFGPQKRKTTKMNVCVITKLLHFLQACGYSLRVCRLLGEHPEDEVALFVWLKGGGDDYVLPFRQLQTWADLPQVDEGFWASAGGMTEEKVSLEVNPWTPSELRGELKELALCCYSILCNIYTQKVEKPHLILPHLESAKTTEMKNYYNQCCNKREKDSGKWEMKLQFFPNRVFKFYKFVCC